MKSSFILLLLLIACVPPRKYATGFSPDDNPREILNYADEEAEYGEDTTAVAVYMQVYADTSIASEFREEALFKTGMLYFDNAESIKDYEKSIEYFRKLMKEFPRTIYREKADRQVKFIRNHIKRMKRNPDSG